MAKQLNVSLAFSADTSQAKAQIQSLQNSLNNLLKSTDLSSSLGLSKAISSATTDVAKLKAQLESATNVKTGQLDLGKFNESLKKSGLKLSDYAKSLQKLGPEGDKAFSQLAQAITTAEVPLRRTNGLLQEFGTTLKNTARWQISSSVLHGLQGAMQGAWSYAKDLNESLTDIRIVTGQSTDQMAKFAEQANKAAKALGTTTTKYTDAALIYYQQGLKDKDVQERTDTTIKMANVTGENATEVSSYMTAIWNNFNKEGDQAVEHYADIMTKLGAETAASTDEIAAGLGKFSAVADTIGLSFEMASSAVTAIIDQTRESPEVVGTALKTIFSRMEGLKQGETLEDGVDLNKYSEGLAKVGVSIMDASGQLKDMDTILYDVGATWETLNKEQQVALAQTVAGTRQYNQFIALFDNWDKVQENLLMAGTAEGTLQEQADIYAESWEAASNRVKAAWQGIYDSLLDDDFIIDLTNGFADFLSIIERLIDSMGGFKGVMTVIGAVMMKTFNADITKNLENMAYNIRSMSAGGRDEIFNLRKKANKELGDMYRDSEKTETGTVKADIFTKQANAQDALINKQEELLRKGKSLTEEEQKQAQIMLDIVKAKNESVLKTIQEKEELDQINKSSQQDVAAWAKRHSTGNSVNINSQLEEYGAATRDHAMLSGLTSTVQSIYNDADIADDAEKIQRIKTLMEGVEAETEEVKKAIISINEIDLSHAEEKINQLETDLAEAANATDKKYNAIIEEATKNTAYQDSQNLKDLTDRVDEFGESCTRNGEKAAEMRRGVLNVSDASEEAEKKIKGFTGKVYTAADGITALASMMMNVTMAIQGIKNLGSIWENDDLSTGEKILQTMTSMSMILPAVISLLNKENYAKLAGIPISLAKALGYKAEAAAAGEAAAATSLLAGSMAFLLPILIPIVTILGLLAAALIKSYKEAHKARNKFDDLTEAAKDSADALSKVKEEAENVNSALDSLESKTEALDDLKVGTAEWASAMRDVNSEVRNLIDAQEDLAESGISPDIQTLIEGEDYYRDSLGVLHLTESGETKIQDNQSAAINVAERANNASQKAMQDAELAATEETILSKNYRYTSEGESHQIFNDGFINLINNIFKTHWDSGTTQSPGTTVVLDEAILNTVVGSLNRDLISADLLSSIPDLMELGLTEEQAELIASNKDLQTSIEDLSIATKENTQSQQNKIEDNLLNNSTVYDTIYGKDSPIAEEFKAGVLSAMSEDILQMANAKTYSQDEINANRDDFARAQGWTVSDGKYTDAEGKEQTVSDEQVSNWLALAEAEQEATNDLQKYIEQSEKSKSVWEAADKIKETWSKSKKPLEDYRKQIQKYNKVLEECGEDSEEAILAEKDLYSSKAAVAEYIDTIQDDFATLIGTSKEVSDKLLTPEFVEANAADIEKAIDGDVAALERLGEKAALSEFAVDANIRFDHLDEDIVTLHDWIASYDNTLNLEVGTAINDAEFIAKCDEIITAAGMTAEQAQDYFSNMGYDVEFNENPQTVKDVMQLPQYWTTGNFLTGLKTHVRVENVEYDRIVKTPTIKTITPNGKGFGGNVIERSSGAGAATPSIGTPPDTGGGSKSKKTFKKIDDVTEADDAGERYKEINDQLSDQERLLSRLNAEDDKLFGAKKVENLKKINKELENQNKLLEDKKQEAITNAKSDKKELDTLLSGKKSKNKDYYKFAKQVSEDFHFDKKNGNIDNYNDVIKDIYQVLEDAEKDFNKKYGDKEFKEGSKKALAAEAAEQNIENIKEWIDAIENGIENYEEANEVIKDTTEEQLDNLDEILSNNFSMLSEVLDNRLMLEEMETTKIDYQMKSIENDFYKKAEYAGLQKQMGQQSEDSLYISQEHIKELERAYKKGDISQADYVTGIKEQYDQIYTDLSDIADRDQEMLEYYGDALAEANEELSKYTAQMEHLSSVLDHYKNVLSLSGQEEDYDKMGEVLDAQAQILSNNHAVAKSNYEMHKANQEQLEKDLAAIKDKNSFEYKLVQENLDAQIAATNEAHSEMMSSAESYLEALNEIWENQTKKLAKTLEKNLTNGMTFDRLLESLQNTKDIADEYLTDTNKVFETNKMLSQIQNDIDKTNNVAAKNRLNNFSKEIEALQEKDKLSNLELEIAQAKYKQLQAQIALEEAQNAKSVVRLSRDNEGNYGYVYTADQDAIGAAEEELAQAENDLYNIQLNATNEYGEKSIQARQELYQALTEIDNTYAKDSDEWFAAREEVMQEYYDKCNVYTELYGIAQQEDSRVVEDAWINSYAEIIDDGGKWQSAVTQYVSDVKTAYDEWKLQMDEQVKPIIGDTLTDLEGKTKAVKDESEKLRDQVVTKTIPGIDGTLDKVKAQTAEYGNWRDNVADLISNMQALADMEAISIKNEVITEYKDIYTEEDNRPKKEEKDKNKDEKKEPAKEENKKPTKSRVKAAYDAINSGSWGNGASRVKNGLAAGYTSEEISLAQQLVDLVYEKSKGGKEYSFAKGWKTIGFDTGGYTGKWGPEGKLAMLHEKEIVLNKEDSANILKVVELVRTMIDANAANAGLSILHSPGINTQNQNLEQTVTITAEFPNATNHNEIEMAFNTLINRATQYANRK